LQSNILRTLNFYYFERFGVILQKGEGANMDVTVIRLSICAYT